MFNIVVLSLALVAVFAQNEVEDVQPKCNPTSEWGTYYEIGADQYKKIFDVAFNNYVSGGKSPASGCNSANQASYNRYYKSYKDDSLFVFSYFCVGNVEREYETMKARMNSAGTAAEGLSVSNKLSDLGITGEHSYSGDEQTDDAAKTKIEELFDAVADSLPEWEECPGNFSTETYPVLKTKYENELNYSSFNVACLEESGKPAHFVTIQVAVDSKCNYYNEGKPILVARGTLNDNAKWVNAYWTGMQKGSTQVYAPFTFLSMILLAVVSKFLFQ